MRVVVTPKARPAPASSHGSVEAMRPRSFSTWLTVALIGLPIAVFGLSSVFAGMLWAVECYGADSGTAADNGEEMVDPCSWYQWLLFVIGNLVGLGNPLTDVGPRSGNTLSEGLCLLVSLWSLALTGCVIGLVGGLAFISNIMGGVDGSSEKVRGALRRQQTVTKVLRQAELHYGGRVTVESLQQLMLSMQARLAEEDVKALFELWDTDSTGVLDQKKFRTGLTKFLREEEARASEEMQLCDRLKKVEANQAAMLASVKRVEESVDALAATVIGIRGRVTRMSSMSSPSLSPGSRLSFSQRDEPPESAEQRTSESAVDVSEAKEAKDGKSVKGVALSWLHAVETSILGQSALPTQSSGIAP